MYSRLVPPLLCALAVAFACRPGTRPTLATAAPKQHKIARAKVHAADSAGVALVLGVTSEDGVRFALKVVNESDKRVEMRFRSGLTTDFLVLDEQSREVWRWSEGRMFTQSVQNKVLAAGDTIAFEESWTPDRPGRYTVVARLNSPNYPTEQRAQFDVPATGTAQLATAH
jgi:hypothetical protein